MKECRIVLMGSGGVGKSALAIRFATGEFVASYDPTIEDFYRHPVDVDGLGVVSLEILDTAGTGQHYNNNRHLYITSGNVFGLVYSVDSKQSFNGLEDVYRDIVRLRRSSSIPIILVGTKCDVDSVTREISAEDARKVVRKSWGVSSRNVPIVIETSAKEGKNVDAVFQHMARLSTSVQPRTPPRGQSATLRARSSPKQKANGVGGGSAGKKRHRHSSATMAHRNYLLPAPSPSAAPVSRSATLTSIQPSRQSVPARTSRWRDRVCVIM